jgi:hypothetical protein
MTMDASTSVAPEPLNILLVASLYQARFRINSFVGRDGRCGFIFRKSFLFYMDVLATGKLQTHDPRARHIFQTPKSIPPLLEKQKKIWTETCRLQAQTRG